MKAIKIVILLSVPDGCEVEVRTGTPEPLPEPPRKAIKYWPEPDPYAPRPPAQEPQTGPADAMLALRSMGVEHPERYTDRYATERILAVCRHAASKRDTLKRPAAWVVSALQRNWTIPGNGR
jgi:hypothetical protein